MLGGIYWLFKAFLRGFEVFPIFSSQFPLTKVFELDNVITITSNLLYMGLQIASPVLLATMGQDIIFGCNIQNGTSNKRISIKFPF
ncbi:MAG: hypothetical protein L6V95_12830 [Candidatus Melainabacteria bacterium]|nr:MAG: hypothetical protein L6V95_12830 [Candidatus Melainabacteria bacterium]